MKTTKQYDNLIMTCYVYCMSATAGFTKTAKQLAKQTHHSPTMPEGWEDMDHSYAQARGIQLMRSPDGGVGVVNHRLRYQTVTELFVSRLALYAGVPVAPTFIVNDTDVGHNVLSVIPFRHFIQSDSTDTSFRHMASYLKHYASYLPFFLLLGADMDRAIHNVCMDNPQRSHFCEFDFENTDLTKVFGAVMLDPESVPENLRHIHQMSVYSSYIEPMLSPDMTEGLDNHWPEETPPMILKSAFMRGLKALNDMPDDAIDSVLDIIDRQIAISARSRAMLKEYLDRRLEYLNLAVRDGEFNHHFIDKLPRQGKIPRNYFMPNTYRF